MKKPALVVMAAGMGSRYGGLKQIDPVDKEGDIIIDFSIYDALQAGFEKIVFVLTRKLGYRKDEKEIFLPRLLLRKHPLLRNPMEDRHYRYNCMLEKVEEMEKQGQAVVIRPTDEMGVDTLTRDTASLMRLYEEGRRAAREQLDALQNII